MRGDTGKVAAMAAWRGSAGRACCETRATATARSRPVARTAARAYVTTASTHCCSSTAHRASPSTDEATEAQHGAGYQQTADWGRGVGPGSGGLVMTTVVLMAMYCQPGWLAAV
jgi:hypothetical protein